MTSKPYRILITGSRNWEDPQAVYSALADVVRELPADREIVVVHGDCPTGADAIADNWAVKYGCQIEAHPAAWWKYGRVAGPRRNTEMVKAGASICLAFIRNGSRGATHCADTAERAGIPVKRWTA